MKRRIFLQAIAATSVAAPIVAMGGIKSAGITTEKIVSAKKILDENEMTATEVRLRQAEMLSNPPLFCDNLASQYHQAVIQQASLNKSKLRAIIKLEQ